MHTAATSEAFEASALVVATATSPVDLALAVWLDAKVKRTGSAQTQRAYQLAIEGFRQVCRDAGGDLDAPDARALANLLQGWAGRSRPDGRPTAAASYNQRVSIVGSFYAFARKRDLLAHLQINPADLLDRRPVQAYSGAQPLDPHDVAARLAAIDTTTLPGLRDRALLTLALMTGRRASELASLRWRHCTLAGGRIMRVHWERLKANKSDRNELDAVTGAAVLAWLHAAYGDELATLDPDAPIWLALSRNLRGRRQAMTTDAIADVYTKRLGVSKIHASRHTFAASMRRAGATDATIQALLGHANLATTNRYLRRLEVTANPHAAGLAALYGLDSSPQ